MKVRRPGLICDSDLTSQEEVDLFHRTLASSLMFSAGFYFDAAWLRLNHVQLLFKQSRYGLPCLTTKGYIQLIARVPRAELALDWAPLWLQKIRIWEWPTPVLAPRRDLVDNYIRFSERKWHISAESVPFTGTSSFDGKNVATLFASEQHDLSLKTLDEHRRFFDGVGIGQKIEVQFHNSTPDKALLWIGRDDWYRLLLSPRLDFLLGVSNDVSNSRLQICNDMRSTIEASVDYEVELKRYALAIAESWGLQPHQVPSNNACIGLSIQEAIGYLSSWKA